MERTTNDEIEQKIQAFLQKKFPLARRAGILKDTALLEKGILDSLGILDLVAFVEGEFSISITDEELSPENFQSLGGLAEFVRRKNGTE